MLKCLSNKKNTIICFIYLYLNITIDIILFYFFIKKIYIKKYIYIDECVIFIYITCLILIIFT